MVNQMLSKAKRNYVLNHHPRAISQLKNAAGYKKDKWKTYIVENGKRKEVIKNTEDELLEWLFLYYDALENRPKTLKDVFEAYANYKLNCLGRTNLTINHDWRMFGYLSKELQNKPINSITDDVIKEWIVQSFMPTKPTESALRKEFQIINQVFEYAIRQKLCSENPMRYISSRDYANRCNLSKKTDEEKAFSLEELNLIREESLKTLSDPRALMRLLSMETGLRAGELPVIHKKDIDEDFIHVHRQQIKDHDSDGHEYFYEVEYTKDEKFHPHNGRYVPITDLAKKIIGYAYNLPGISDYLFHDNGSMISKDSYVQNLKRFCRKHGINTTNNHAFRMAFNSRLIEMDFSASDRALILGHQVQTNETHYSLTDRRRLASIKERLK